MIKVAGLSDRQRVDGLVSFTPGTEQQNDRVDRFELFLDGRRIARCSLGEPFSLDTTLLADGWHELRVVGSENTAIESQGGTSLNIVVDNHGRSVEFVGPEKPGVKDDKSITIRARSVGATQIRLFSNGQPLAQIPGPGGKVILKAGHLGRGPVVLRAVAYHKNLPHAIAEPIRLHVTE